MIYFISDCGNYETNEFQKLLNLLKKKKLTRYDLIIFGGDMFYPYGVINGEELNKFKSTFGSLECLKYGILGNHEYYGNEDLILKSDIFDIKDGYNHVKHEGVDIFLIDTMILAPHLDPAVHMKLLRKYGGEQGLINKQQEIIANLEYGLSKSNRDYRNIKMVVGHYPLITLGTYKNNGYECLFKLLMPLLNKYNVNYYVSGHDHNTQSIDFEDIITDNTLTHIVAGGVTELYNDLPLSKKSIEYFRIMLEDVYKVRFNFLSSKKHYLLKYHSFRDKVKFINIDKS